MCCPRRRKGRGGRDKQELEEIQRHRQCARNSGPTVCPPQDTQQGASCVLCPRPGEQICGQGWICSPEGQPHSWGQTGEWEGQERR